MTQPVALRELFRSAFVAPLRVLGALALLSVAQPQRARADVPPLLPIQGYLTDKTSMPLDGSKMVAFRLYAAPTGGTPLHEELLQVVATDGYFTAYLGDDSLHPLDLSKLRDNAKVFLGIEVDKDGEGVPRLQLASTAFAAQAAFCSDATNFAGRAPSTFADASHSHDWGMVTGKPTEFAPAPHTHGDADISCYADLGAEGYLDGDSATDVLLRGQADSAYATKGHGHDASEISSGTLASARFDAYADLGADGHLGNGNLLSQAQGDTRYVNANEVSSVNSNMIVDGAVGSADIADGTVGSADIADGTLVSADIADGTIVTADLAGNSVTMDKTSAPIGAITSSQVINSTGTTQMLVTPVLAPDAQGTCVITATVRTSGTAGPTGYFYAQPIVQANSGAIGGIGGTTVGYGMPTVFGNSLFQTNTISGAVTVSAGSTYQFGCGVFMTAGSTFSGNTFTCVTTWICN